MISIFHLHFSKHILIIKSSHLVWATINKRQQIVNQLQATLYENNITGPRRFHSKQLEILCNTLRKKHFCFLKT